MVFDGVFVEPEVVEITRIPKDDIKSTLAIGMKDGVIGGDIHECVEYVNDSILLNELGYSNVSGDDVSGVIKELIDELCQLNAKADELAAQGLGVTDIAKMLTPIEGAFTFDDIKAYKIDKYGSVIAWKAEMTAE